MIRFLIALTLLVGCRGEREVVRVGAKNFSEQKIMGQMLSQRLAAVGLESRIVPCGDTWSCQRMVRDGEIDLMVEYSGTALQFIGGPPADRKAPFKQVQRLYEPQGIHWLADLGFDNAYLLVTNPEASTTANITTISDLSQLERLRLACPSEYARRPRDGLASLLRRYGLSLTGPALLIDNAAERYAAVMEGRADVAVGYGTDGDLVGLDFRFLDDDLGFYPPYQAGIVAGAKALERHPAIKEATDALSGILPTERMRQINFQATVQGNSPAELASRILSESEIPAGPPAGKGLQPAVLVAKHPSDNFGALEVSALRAVRQAFDSRPAKIAPSKTPVKDTVAGKSRLMLLGSERFFEGETREERLEAAAVVGSRVLHLVRKAAGGLTGNVGIPPEGSGASTLAEAVVGLTDNATVARRATTAELLAAVASGELDAALLVAPPGDSEVVEGLSTHQLTVSGLPNWLDANRARALPYLVRARIAANTYSGQTSAVETVGSQVVLASVARATAEAALAGGPASAMSSRATALSHTQVSDSAAATGVPESPDPALPSAWTNTPAPDPDSAFRAGVDTALNVFALLFLGWLGIQIASAARPEDA